jgi:FG-GAP-like repeat
MYVSTGGDPPLRRIWGLVMRPFSQSCRSCLVVAAFTVLGSALPFKPALSEFIQQGQKLVGLGANGMSEQGSAVAISADGNTAIVGGPGDSSEMGAAWVLTRSNGVWTPQEGKLFGLGAIGSKPKQGASVALSADGNTALVGGPGDNGGAGAVWVFTRSNGVWSPQGGKLVGTGAAGPALQGWSVALSADGNTALIGGQDDNIAVGASWVFIRTGSTWSQQGNKLVGMGVSGGSSCQGTSVALSADGNTALIGGGCDDANVGAAWVFTRTAGAWTQYGSKLVGSFPGAAQQGSSVALSSDGLTALIGAPYDDCGDPGGVYVFALVNGTWTQQTRMAGGGSNGSQILQGSAVALSADGNIALVGGPADSAATGAAWVFTRSDGVWSEQGFKRVGSGVAGDAASQGTSVALSASGNTALIGGPLDNTAVGATWVFIPPTNTHDFNGNTLSDIAWRDTSGDIAAWLMSGAAVASSAGLGNVPTTWSIVAQRDFDGDGNADLLWRDTSGNTSIWFMKGTQVASSGAIGNIPPTWSVIATGDFNGDGKGDILWRDGSGNVAVWLMSGAAVSSSRGLGNVPSTWSVVGTGDFDADGAADLLWRDTSGNTAIWFMSGTQVSSSAGIGNIPTSWSVVGTGDFNGDSFADIAWRDTSGNTSIWLLNGATVMAVGGLGTVPTIWSIAQVGDYNGDGMSDLMWRDTSGNTSIWFMNGTTVASTAGVGNIPTNWTVQSVNAE